VLVAQDMVGLCIPLLDNVCIDSLSIDLTRPILDASARSIGILAEKIQE
jgi:DNA excision repair protein ERCC-2